MISAYPIGTYSISELGDGTPLDITGGVTVILAAPTITILTAYRDLSGIASLSLAVSGAIKSTNVVNNASSIISLITNGNIASPNTILGRAPLSLVGRGSIAVPNGVFMAAILSLTSAANLSIPVTLRGTAAISITSSSSILNSIKLEDLVYSTYGINTTTAGHFVYSTYSFNSFFKLDNNYFATSASGIYKLDGINTTIWMAKSAQTNFGTESAKNIPDVYIDMRNTNDVFFALTVDDFINREGYTISSNDNAGLRKRRAKTHKGLRGNNWQAQISGEGTAEVKQVDCRVSEFKRSIY